MFALTSDLTETLLTSSTEQLHAKSPDFPEMFSQEVFQKCYHL